MDLATTLDERQDIDDSIARVDEMLKLKATGRFDDALKLAVLSEEAEDIDRERKAKAAADAPAPPAPSAAPPAAFKSGTSRTSLTRTRQLTGDL
mmetsp:Transcript_38317/g.112186  ORF Transcript_38317/g.112186 Transcript_38317/m.112186 type:complete len:94 (+) Transcript_38317:404-685(+)